MSDEARIIATIKKVLPAVVSVGVERRLRDLERDDLRGRKDDLRIAGLLADKRGMVDVGGGSGFLVSPDGLVLTNKHVIGDAKARYVVTLGDGRELPAELASRDVVNDIAILRLGRAGAKAKTALPYIPLCRTDRLALGQTVVAVGNALGLFANTVSAGIVSGLSRAITAQENAKASPHELRGLIQTDAAINPGNSGGPLVNLKGEAVGINTAVLADAENIGFAIPVRAARRDLAELARWGEVRRPSLGIRYLATDDGALVVPEGPRDPGVVPGGPAARAGIREGDVIISIDGGAITSRRTVQDVLENFSAGDTVTLAVLRDGKTRQVRVKLAERK